MSSVKQCFIFISILAINTLQGVGSSACPESKKQHPGDCRLFYKCLPMPAQAYAWVPSRCTAGLIFHPKWQKCVQPNETWKCSQIEEFDDEDLITDENGETDYDSNYPELSTDQSTLLDNTNSDKNFPPTTFLSETNSVPLSAVNNPDEIASQMSHLSQLINTLKTTSTNQISHQSSFSDYLGFPTFDLNFPLNQPIDGTNVLPSQIYKITAQLITQPYPYSNGVRHQIKPNNPHQTVVSDLYNKFLSNNSYLNQGEFVNKYQNQGKHKYTTNCEIGDRIPNPSDCTKYYMCKNDFSLLTFSCPSNTAFNKIKKVCDVKGFNKCFKIYNEILEDKRICVVGTRVADPFSKHNYYICVAKDGNWSDFKVKCPNYLEFCPRTKTCMPNCF